MYSSPAVWRDLVFEGSYDGYFYALNAASGRWSGGSTPAPRSRASPTVLDGIVYVSSFARRTWGLNARTGRVVWRFRDGRYSPVTADRQTLYLNGNTPSTRSCPNADRPFARTDGTRYDLPERTDRRHFEGDDRHSSPSRPAARRASR